jgi:hypothetical protein
MSDDERLARLEATVSALLLHLDLTDYQLVREAELRRGAAQAKQADRDKVRAEIDADLAARTRDYKRSLGIKEDFKLDCER